MVAQGRVRIEVWRRRANEEWEIEFLTQTDDTLELESVGLSLGVAQVYRKCAFRYLTAAGRRIAAKKCTPACAKKRENKSFRTFSKS